jgi:hypothetical protein
MSKIEAASGSRLHITKGQCKIRDLDQQENFKVNGYRRDSVT